MNSISNYDKYKISFHCYFLLYHSILELKKYDQHFIDLFLTTLKFLVEKHYFERDYIIESKSSFFDSIEWYLRQKL